MWVTFGDIREFSFDYCVLVFDLTINTLVNKAGMMKYPTIGNNLLAMEGFFSEDLWVNRDWDPCYLNELFREDFNDYSHMWYSNVSDGELVQEVNKIERYCPITEDISMDDTELCTAVEKIKEEGVKFCYIKFHLIFV